MNPNILQLLPEEFLSRIREQMNSDYDSFIESFKVTPPVSIRNNPFKRISKFETCEKVPWATDAFYLPERISFTLDPLFHAGCYYVQEASSMYLETVVKSVISNDKPLKVLDLCAAPGGKSTHLVSILPSGSVIISNEVISSRNKILQQNISKWGEANVVVTQNDPSDFKRLPSYFDLIIVDARCSGEGLFCKDIKACNEWNIPAVDKCAIRQRLILKDVINCLKKDGILIYSTCTYETTENDDQVAKLIHEEEFECLALPHYNGIQQTKYGSQFYPHRIKGEGFYLSMLRKKNSTPGNINYGKSEYNSKHENLVSSWIEDFRQFKIFQKENEIYIVPDFMQQDFTLLMKNLYVRQAGVHLGQLIKNNLVPSHQLALYNGLNKKVLRLELAIEQALMYLRGETFSIPGLMLGWYVVTFNNMPLGWIKALGTRINNYFPKELKVLMKG